VAALLDLGENFLVVQFEKLIANKSAMYPQILSFLGLPHANLTPDDYEKQFPQRRPILTDPEQLLSSGTEKYLRQFFKPYNDELADMLGEEWRGVWD